MSGSVYPLWTTPHHRGDAGLAVLEQYVGLRGQKRIAFVDQVGRVFHYDLSEVHRGWGGNFRITDVNPEWEETVRRYLRPRRPRSIEELKRARKGVVGECPRTRRVRLSEASRSHRRGTGGEAGFVLRS